MIKEEMLIKSQQFLKVSIVMIVISIIFIEIFMRLFFGPPIRMQYDFSLSRLNSESDFEITYYYDFKNGYRQFNLDCKNFEEKILIVGDSAAFSQGIKNENTLSRLLDKDFCVENWSMIGKDLKFIKHNLIQKKEKVKNFDKILIILHDNDTQNGYDQNKMKFAKIREYLNYKSYSYNFLKIFRKFISEQSKNSEPVLIDGRINNPANLFNNNPNALEIWFDLESNKNEVESQLNQILSVSNKKANKIFMFIIPAPSVCSLTHREFYTLNNVGWLPDYDKRSDLDIYLEKKCIDGNCTYLPLYKDICDKQKKDGDIFYPRDFHLNSNGQLFLYKQLLEYIF